jgi:hypothetical protein
MVYVNALSELETDGLAEDEKPWCDLVFDIESVRRPGAGWFRRAQMFEFDAAGMANGTTIGFAARIPLTGWNGQLRNGIRLTWGAVDLVSKGEQTNQLLALYEEWFGLDRSGASAVDCRCAAVILNDDPLKLERQLIHMKLFFEPIPPADSGDDYAELYLNFDLPNGRAWLREKDPGYRNALVSWLSGRYRPAHESVH